MMNTHYMFLKLLEIQENEAAKKDDYDTAEQIQKQIRIIKSKSFNSKHCM